MTSACGNFFNLLMSEKILYKIHTGLLNKMVQYLQKRAGNIKKNHASTSFCSILVNCVYIWFVIMIILSKQLSARKVFVQRIRYLYFIINTKSISSFCKLTLWIYLNLSALAWAAFTSLFIYFSIYAATRMLILS